MPKHLVGVRARIVLEVVTVDIEKCIIITTKIILLHYSLVHRISNNASTIKLNIFKLSRGLKTLAHIFATIINTLKLGNYFFIFK